MFYSTPKRNDLKLAGFKPFLFSRNIKIYLCGEANMDIKKTNAARILDRQKIQYELIPYTVDENDLGAQHVADTLGEDINQVFKTILVHGDKIGYLMCVIPGNHAH
jgi:hypothetical protein